MKKMIDPTSVYALKRFGLKFAILIASSLAQFRLRWGAIDAFIALMFLSASVSGIIAIYNREPIRKGAFNYWDESLLFLVFGGLAYLFL